MKFEEISLSLSICGPDNFSGFDSLGSEVAEN